MPWQLDKRVPRAAFWILGPLEMSCELIRATYEGLAGITSAYIFLYIHIYHIYICVYIYIYIYVYRCVYIFVFFLMLLHRCLEVLCWWYWFVLYVKGFRSILLQGFVSDCICDPQPKPQTLNNSKPETLTRGQPKPETLNSKPETLNSKPEALNSKPETLNSKPETLNSKPETLNRAWVMLWDNGCRLAWLFLERAARAAGQGRARISDPMRV